jgi:hypothetical protein
MRTMDISFFLEQILRCFKMEGSSNPEYSLDYSHHHQNFDIDKIPA